MSVARVGIAQINACVGDLAANAEQVLRAARQAYQQGADILLTPELVLTGYPPEDLLLRPSFLQNQQDVLARLRQKMADMLGLHVLLGHVWSSQGRIYNAVSVLCEGQIIGTYCKHELPNYAVFDEQRYFEAHDTPLVLNVKGVCFGVNICEDIWFTHAPDAAMRAGAQVLLVANASPYHIGKQQERQDVARRCVAQTGCAIIYANIVGGQDDLVFDGASFALDAAGRLAVCLPEFSEALSVVDVDATGVVQQISAPTQVAQDGLEAQVWKALVLALRDYLGKNRFPGAIIGLSGGIDSAVVLALAVDALGADQVRAVMMPTRYTADISRIDAQEMARRLHVRYDDIAIGLAVDAFDELLMPQFAGLAPDVTQENIQARVRAVLLMALSNKTGWLVLTTGNKSEMATGYCTLYGDMAGGFAVLKDIPKTLVYRLAVWRNLQTAVIPERIITRLPSAELRPNQTDQDTLPPYDIVDGIIERYVVRNESARQIVAAGYSPQVVTHVLGLIRSNEYKRRQAPLGPRITPRAFARDWRHPVTNGFREEP